MIFSSATGGTTPFTITGSVSVGTIDGSHLSLTPSTGFRSTTPDTLTVAASGCPSTTLGVEHSPAIYVENSQYYVRILDWYGDVVGGNTVASGDAVVGYDTQSARMMTYNSATGQVNAYTVDLYTSTPKFVAPAGWLVGWSNYAHGLFGAAVSGTNTTYYKDVNGVLTTLGSSTTYAAVAVAASTFSSSPNAYTALADGEIGRFSVATPGVIASSGLAASPISLATDDRSSFLFQFNSATPYVTQYNESLGSPFSGTFGFVAPAAVGAADTDGDNVYMITAGGAVYASTFNGTVLSGFGYGIGMPFAIAVLSTNER